jgi:hypothetical protein
MRESSNGTICIRIVIPLGIFFSNAMNERTKICSTGMACSRTILLLSFVLPTDRPTIPSITFNQLSILVMVPVIECRSTGTCITCSTGSSTICCTTGSGIARDRTAGSSVPMMIGTLFTCSIPVVQGQYGHFLAVL